MKLVTLYIILLAYGMMLISPVAPLIKDAWQHCFDLSQHLSRVHYENGKYHIHKELAKESKSSGKENKSCLKKYSPQNDLFLTSFTSGNEDLPRFTSHEQFHGSIFKNSDFPPLLRPPSC